MTEQQVHRIRLAGPWEYEWLDRPHASGDSGDSRAEPSGLTGTRVEPARAELSGPEQSAEEPLKSGGRIRIPVSWREAFGNQAGTVRFLRRFHQPTNLDPQERVRLVLPPVAGCRTVSLNGCPLLATSGDSSNDRRPTRLDVTGLLEPNNALTLTVTFDPARSAAPGGLTEPVTLEIGPAPRGEERPDAAHPD